jgi:hypothetical protein
VRTASGIAVAWHGADHSMHVSQAADLPVGTASGNPGDYVTATLHAGRVVTAFPVAGGVRVVAA